MYAQPNTAGAGAAVAPKYGRGERRAYLFPDVSERERERVSQKTAGGRYFFYYLFLLIRDDDRRR